MFERLAGKFLSRLLSKYFHSSDANGNGSSSPDWRRSTASSSSRTQLGVWSGYVCLENMELRKEVVNDILKSKGLPFELLHCTLERVEITVPWAKLGLASSYSTSADAQDAVVVVVVVDGVHALLRTNYELDDNALREAAVAERRQQLLDSEAFGKETNSKSGFSSGLSGFLQKQLAEGILKDVMEKLHIHVRDVHVRVEDVESDPTNPYAFGITLESLHVQADEDDSEQPSDVIRKVAQLNHFAIYWNALAYGDGISTEISILQDAILSSAALSQALDRCIERRVSSISSSVSTRLAHIPLHTYLLQPLDGACHLALSTTPKNLERQPALVATLHIDLLSVQLRDFQCSQIVQLLASIKEQSFVKDYRKYRPVASAKEDPKAWWMYLFRIIRLELRQSSVRWSWRRFHERYSLRQRYCYLYERHRRNSSSQQLSRSFSAISLASAHESTTRLALDGCTTPDEGAGPSLDASNGPTVYSALNEEEAFELQAIEDGIQGDLSVQDIVLFRALVNARLAGNADDQVAVVRPSVLRRIMSSVVSDDIAAEEESERLLAYLEKEREPVVDNEAGSMLAVTMETQFQEVRITLLCPLPSTADLVQHRRIQHRFLELKLHGFGVGYHLFGNYESFRLKILLDDFAGTETRSNMKDFSVISRLNKLSTDFRVSNGDTPQTSNKFIMLNGGASQTSNKLVSESAPLVSIDVSSNSPGGEECDLGVSAAVDAIEISLMPQDEWLANIKKLVSSIPSTQNFSKFWEDIMMAQINSMKSLRQGLLAKAEAAVFNHKNTDLNISVRCPTLKIGDSLGNALVVDLGRAVLQTERLAGVATDRLSVSLAPLGTNQDGATTSASMNPTLSAAGSSDLPTIVSTRKRSNSRGNISFGTPARKLLRFGSSVSQDEGSRPYAEREESDPQSPLARNLQSSFYDVFHLKLFDTSISLLADENAGNSEVLKDLEVLVVLEKSVLPSDHTLCRFKVHCIVNSIDVQLTQSVISASLGILQGWQSAVSALPVTRRPRSKSLSRRLSVSFADDHEDEGTQSDVSSILDENEFIDALENESREIEDSWFDVEWAEDGESVLEGESQSARRSRPYRKARSVSDVSSISEMSHRKPRWTSGDYLSAENLARLEEQGGEDESTATNESKRTTESFHSALSLGGQAEVAKALQSDIERTEDDAAALRKKLAALAQNLKGSSIATKVEVKTRRLAKRSLKLELDRTLAELRALRASHEEILSQINTATTLHYNERLDGDVKEGNYIPSITGSGTAGHSVPFDSTFRAKELLRARKQRRKQSNTAEESFKHSITSSLNRELYRFSLSLLSFTITLNDLTYYESERELSNDSMASFKMNFSQSSFVLLRRAKETRIFASVGHASASLRLSGLLNSDPKKVLFYGGSRHPETYTSVPALHPQYISSSGSDSKLLRLTLGLQERKRASNDQRTTCATQLRLLLGDIEICPDLDLLRSLLSKKSKLEAANGIEDLPAKPKPSKKTGFSICRVCDILSGGVASSGSVFPDMNSKATFLDTSVHLTSFRIKIVGQSARYRGAFVVTETGLRFVRAQTGVILATRSQLDMKCNNVQLIAINEDNQLPALELIGRRDPYHPLVCLRIRTQLVPVSELGGWVTEGEASQALVTEQSIEESVAWNMHMGLRISSAYITAAMKDLQNISLSVSEIVELLRDKELVEVTESSLSHGEEIDSYEESDLDLYDDERTLVRWRADIAVRKTTVVFPRHSRREQLRSLTEGIGSSLVMPFSLHVYIEEAEIPRVAVVNAALVDLSILRSSDDWPLLENMSLKNETRFRARFLERRNWLANLNVPAEFSWCDGSSFKVRHLKVDMLGNPGESERATLCVSISPARFNFSAEICHLLREILSEVSPKPSRALKEKKQKQDYPAARSTATLESVDIKILLEPKGRASTISYAVPVVSFVAHGIVLSARQDKPMMNASLKIDDILLHDLRTLPGVLVIGKLRSWSSVQDFAQQERPLNMEGPFARFSISLYRPQKADSQVSLKLQWHGIQVFLVPSIFDSILTFQRAAFNAPRKPASLAVQSQTPDLKLPFGAKHASFAVLIEGFEFILPSREVCKYVQNKSKDPISVVTVRWSSRFEGWLALAGTKGEVAKSIVDKVLPDIVKMKDVDPLLEPLFSQIENHLDLALQSHAEETKSDSSPPYLALKNVVTAAMELNVKNFQVLRTQVRKLPFRTAAAGDPHISPYEFCVRPPAAGEQRITNPFTFNISYQLAGTVATIYECLNASKNVEESEATATDRHASISHSLQVNAAFIDTLVYVSQSVGGMHDASRVTLMPILNLLKGKEAVPRGPKHVRAGQRLSDAFKNAITVCAVQIEGIKCTFVPGGATKLTESPIVKFELSDCQIGMAMAAVPTDMQLNMVPSERFELDSEGEIADGFSKTAARTPVHPTIGGWFVAKLSASYHNRRLVAWEPVVEPWTFSVHVGADLVKACNVSPSSLLLHQSIWTFRDAGRDEHFFPGFIPDAGERIRDLGRLLRSPFKGDAPMKPIGSTGRTELHNLNDLCFLIMSMIERKSVALAVLPDSRHQPSEVCSPPGKTPLTWLRVFGYPEDIVPEISVERPSSAVIISASDRNCLNINITGALIENIQGFLMTDSDKSRPIAPHLIRNESGLTIRVREELDIERTGRSDRASKLTIFNRCEVPLSLKRSMSQSCDPHRAYVSLELGSLEDTAGRIDFDDYHIPKGRRSASFFFRAVGRIPVDTVGVNSYPLTRNADISAAGAASNVLGFVIIRVLLQGGTKIVSVESPILLKNNADTEIVCELRDHDGISLLWQSLIPGLSVALGPKDATNKDYVPIPVDLVAPLSDGRVALSARAVPKGMIADEEYLGVSKQSRPVSITIPPPYSKNSLGRGLIQQSETSLEMLLQRNTLQHHNLVNLNTCAFRIGSFSVDDKMATASVSSSRALDSQLFIPEQRMLLFRPPLLFRNHLPVSVIIQVRVKRAASGLRRASSVGHFRTSPFDEGYSHPQALGNDWEDLGVVACGNSAIWTGAVADDRVEVRVKLFDKGDNSRRFPSWSTSATIPSVPAHGRTLSNTADSSWNKLKVTDPDGIPLWVSVGLDYGSSATDSDSAPVQDIRWFGHHLAEAPRVVSLYVPFWVLNCTSRDLEFLSNARIAGQIARCSAEQNTSLEEYLRKDAQHDRPGRSVELGLAELLDEGGMGNLSGGSSFDIVMIGDEKSTRLSMRTRAPRSGVRNDPSLDLVSPWCEPIALGAREGSCLEIFVSPPAEVSESGELFGDLRFSAEPLALRSRILAAPDEFGGKNGTKLVQIVSSYQILNEMGREIEIVAEYGSGVPVTVGVNGHPTAFHFDDSSPIRFRPKEFGWMWSGYFRLKKRRREFSLRLLHRLKGLAIIAEVEVCTGKRSPGCTLVFREASHPPFRLENHTMYPIHFGQSSVLFSDNDSDRRIKESLENTLLPYHHANYAWDEPHEGRRSLLLQLADFDAASEFRSGSDKKVLGKFSLEHIAPGTMLRLRNPSFIGQVVADGPTRVLRISDTSLPRLHENERDVGIQVGKPLSASNRTSWIGVKLSSIGISIVDWSPQELIYIHLTEISLERGVSSSCENASLLVGSVSVDNQLWVTPYPVLLKVGRPRKHDIVPERRRRRKHNAISISLRRALHVHGRLKIFDNIEVSIEPINLSVDGNLSELVWRMVRQAIGSVEDSRSGRGTIDEDLRDAKLRDLLGLSEDRAVLVGRFESGKLDLTNARENLEFEIDDGFVATAAAAARLLTRPRSSSFTARSNQPFTSRRTKLRSLSPASQRTKYYIERFKISTIKTEISWSGPLPSAILGIPDILRPALTFESLPVLLRPFASSHAYGAIDDIAQEVKSHYLSIWRLLDVLVGLSFRPTFLIRACIYTWRESFARVFESISDIFVGSKEWIVTAPSRASSGTAAGHDRQVVGGPVAATSLFDAAANIASKIASSLRYGGKVKEFSRGTLRARNPRLFAHVEGKELLVEYVQGQNAGKAILSRVRMGRYLGEGYIFHAEDVRVHTKGSWLSKDSRSSPFICMVTSERIMLLSGDRDAHFCSVVWEVASENLVNVEIAESDDVSSDSVTLWYLMDTKSATGNGDDRLLRYAMTVMSDSEWGLDTLLSKQIIVERGIGKILRSRIEDVYKGFDEFKVSRDR